MTTRTPHEAGTGHVGIAGFWHETNSFSPYLTDLEAFAGATGAFLRGPAMASRFETDSGTAGFARAARNADLPLTSIVDAWAWPSGTITHAAFTAIADEIADGMLAIEAPTAFLLNLHGAAVAEGCGDPEGSIVARLRAARPRVPIGVVLDHHAGVSEELVAASDIVVGYKTEPHVDVADCGDRAGQIAFALARGEIERIERCFVRLPVLLPIENLLTTQGGPLATLMERARLLQERPEVLDISLFPGFAYSDKPASGAAVLVQTRGDAAAARAVAIDLAAEFWERRGEFTRPAEGADECVERALRSLEPPVILVDKADHPGAGGVGDGSLLLRLLCQRGATGAVVAPIHDPASVARAVELGIGGSGRFRIGGRYTGTPFETEARVRLLSDGTYEALGPVDHGAILSIGRCAVLEIGGVEAVVCEGRSGVNDPELLRRLGLEPTRRRILAIKGLGTFRAAFEPIAGEVIMVDGEGAASQNLAQLPYRNLTRPIEPLDHEVAFEPAAAATLVPSRVWA